jgi:small basic protein
MVLDLKRILLIAAILILISLPFSTTIPATAQKQRKAVILSSLDNLVPMGIYRTLITRQLERTGYNVTFFANNAVTIDFLLNQLSDYDLVLWRTNVYNINHVQYWFVGEAYSPAMEQKYASDIAAGWIDVNAGIVGVSIGFFSNHFASASLGNVRLAVLISSKSNEIAPMLIRAGVGAVVFCDGYITLMFGTIDSYTGLLMSKLVSGQTVLDAVFNTVSPFSRDQPKDPLDSNYVPPFWFVGDSTLTIT